MASAAGLQRPPRLRLDLAIQSPWDARPLTVALPPSKPCTTPTKKSATEPPRCADQTSDRQHATHPRTSIRVPARHPRAASTPDRRSQ
uniref:Uncharacterized protein n=1 Tax=Leersia perrieri TaxID=77586 RepID=A0A0D9VZL4_9ORYZ